MVNAKPAQNFGNSFFFLGVFTGLVLAVIAIWNNVEATNYFFKGMKYPPFDGLHCPVMIGPTETGVVSALFRNPATEADTFYYRAEISGRSFSGRNVEGHMEVPPRQVKSVNFAVDSRDVDLLFFILVRLTIMPNSTHPSQEATCGIMVVNLAGMSGSQVSLAALLLSFAGMAMGLAFWHQIPFRPKRDQRQLAPIIGFALLLSLFAVAMAWWVLAIVLLVIVVLLTVISLRFAVYESSDWPSE